MTPPRPAIYYLTSGTSAVTRRRFLSGTAVTAAAIALCNPSPADAADPGPMRKFKISLTPGMIGVRARLKDELTLAAQFGFEAIEPLAGELTLMPDDALAKFRDDMKSKNIVWGATTSSIPFAGSDAQYKSWLAKLPATAAVLQRAGATRFGTWLTPGDNQMTYVENFRQQAKRIAEVSKILDDHGIVFGLEYLGPKTMRARLKYPFVHCMREMRELIAETGAKNLGLMLDSWHWFNAGDSLAEIKALTNHDVVFVHINDAPANTPLDQQVDNHRALPATTGVINIGGFLAALIEIGYDGPVSAEPFDDNLKRMPREKALQLTIDSIHAALAKA